MNKYVKVAAHALIKKGDRYLTMRRAKINDYMPEFWDLPGGTIEFGEKIKTALKREIFEETGLKVKVNQIIFAFDLLTNPLRHQFWVIYACDYINGDIKLNLEEHGKFIWMTKDEMREIRTIAFLKEYLKS